MKLAHDELTSGRLLMCSNRPWLVGAGAHQSAEVGRNDPNCRLFRDP
jgi:hypothetical protein